jgi:hypothetical protein
MTDHQSTSALPRQTQADLTRVTAERDDARAELATTQDELAAAVDLAARARADLARLRVQFRDLIARPGWIVARDGGRDCLRCDGEIRRGEAYELVPGEGPDALRHVHCRGPQNSPPNLGAGPREEHR